MKTQVAIVGGGPAGTGLAISLRKHGIDSIILEKESFPRLHVGESMTAECGASVRALGLEAEMAERNFPVKWGTMVYGTGGRNSFFIPVMGRDENNNMIRQPAWQVRRADFDKMLLDRCVDQGITTIRATATDVLKNAQGVPCGVVCKTPEGEIKEIHADFVADASGQQTFLSTKGVSGKRNLGRYSKQLAIFSHFKSVKRPAPGEEGEMMPDDTIIFYKERNHWSWLIPITDELVSIGVVSPTDYFRSQAESMKDFLLREMQTLNPQLARRVGDAVMVEDAHSVANYSYYTRDYGGPGFLCVGDAHRFMDPIFSFGLHFTLVECRKAADAIADYLGGKLKGANPFAEHMKFCELGMDNIQVLLDTFWSYPFAFSLYSKDPKYRDGFIDLFAGRCYVTDPPACIPALRKLQVEVPADAAVAI